MTAQQQDRFSEFQSVLLWIAIAALAAKFGLDTNSAKDMFGTWWLMVKQSNAVIMWLAAILSGKKLLDLIDRFKKVAEETKLKRD